MLKKRTTKLIMTILMVLSLSTQVAFAHSGRTDSNGGHKDNKNKSGLGSYHYHCGGHPAHLHNNGSCPYSGSSSSSNSSSSSSQSSSSTSTTNDNAERDAAKQSGYNSGYEAGCNGQAFSDNNSSSYSSEYKSGYSNGYEKGKAELDSKVKGAYDEGFALGSKGENQNNTYTVQAIKDSYSKGYTEGLKGYIEQNSAAYIQYAEEDAVNFKMRTFEGNVPAGLKEKYTTAYNNKTTKLKKAAYDEAYAQAIESKESDSSKYKTNEEIKSYNEGYNTGVIDIEKETKNAYESGLNGEDYSVPEKFEVVNEVLLASYNKGSDELKAEKAKKKKTAKTTVGLLAVAGISGGVVKKRKRK